MILVPLLSLIHTSQGPRHPGCLQIAGPAMELGWLLGHVVYVRGLLPELFGALAESQEALSPQTTTAVPLDPLQTVLLELLSEEMENGSTRQQLM